MLRSKACSREKDRVKKKRKRDRKGKERERDNVARLGHSSMHNVSADRAEKEENKGRVEQGSWERGRVRRGDGTFVRTSAATASDEARNVGKERIRIFLGPRLNVIFRGAEGYPYPYDSRQRREEKVLRYIRLIWRPLFRPSPWLRWFHYIYELVNSTKSTDFCARHDSSVRRSFWDAGICI